MKSTKLFGSFRSNLPAWVIRCKRSARESWPIFRYFIQDGFFTGHAPSSLVMVFFRALGGAKKKRPLFIWGNCILDIYDGNCLYIFVCASLNNNLQRIVNPLLHQPMDHGPWWPPSKWTLSRDPSKGPQRQIHPELCRSRASQGGCHWAPRFQTLQGTRQRDVHTIRSPQRIC